jgi:FHA domain
MARLTCARCTADVNQADLFCDACGANLLKDGATVEVQETSSPAASTPATEPPALVQPTSGSAVPTVPPVPQPGRPLVSSPSLRPASGAGAELGPAQCPHCGAEVAPGSLVCIECLREISPTAPSPSPPSAGAAPDPYATQREPGGSRLVVSFAFGRIELSVGEEALIGRDTTERQLGALDGMMNVSRRHATVGLTPRGAWVRDENSANGTFVNGQPVRVGETVDLPEGAELRLASNVRATVRYRRPGEADHG